MNGNSDSAFSGQSWQNAQTISGAPQRVAQQQVQHRVPQSNQQAPPPPPPQQQQQQIHRRPDLKNYHFASTSQEILRKYSKYPASMSLHIFETHYRFNNLNDSNIIPNTSPMIKDFLRHVLREEIPVEMSELLKDFSIKSYDGCLILQVYDHRNMITTTKNSTTDKNNNNNNNNNNNSTTNTNTNTNTNTKQEGTSSTNQSQSNLVSTPKTYRTLLRPTQLSLYYDLLFHTDHALTKFTDALSLQMESEILTLTKRKLDLSVPLNPYLNNDYLKPDSEYPKKIWDESINDYKLEFSHRQGQEIPPRKIHQDEIVLHKSSEYEEIMLLLSNKYKKSDETQDRKLVIVGSSLSSTAPAPIPSKPISKENTSGPDSKGKKPDKPTTAPAQVTTTSSSSRPTGQFMRLRLIEEIRKKRETEKQEAKLQAQAQTNLQQPPQQGEGWQSNGQVPEPAKPLDNGPVPKRVKKEPIKSNLPPQSNQLNNNNNNNTPGGGFQNSGVVRNGSYASASSNISSGSSQNGGSQPTSQQSQTSQPPSQRPTSLQQQQQQQIFQNSLSPEEQQAFRQMQSRMQSLAVMGNTGVAPNGQQLTPQQRQQAIQQTKLIHQQMLQKFPVYFERLREFQLIQQQRQQKQKQLEQKQMQAAASKSQQLPLQQQQQQQQMTQLPQQQFSQQHINIAGKTIPGNSNIAEPPKSAEKKKRTYKKKNTTTAT
ncbi:Spt20 family-domain-containing protein [Scheffersomyces amazonensis]|uniref:Spt20 family-domain-containing protein n=1 Tax=Scheffersomyces amazonensis TaxID=1078765 RepID=UPI00315D86DB